VLLVTFAAVALVLASIGIYGVMSFSVAQRTREMGIRMALGAQRSDVVRLIVSQGARLAALGAAVGLLGSILTGQLLAGLLFGVSPVDPLTLGGIAAVLLVIAVLASYLPARRATRADPGMTLRAE
jgi:putative ABC transport system permease protein